jgi:hypothetical protein
VSAAPGFAILSGRTGLVSEWRPGSGSLDARNLLAGQADVLVRGPGNAVVNVKAKADAGPALLEKSRVVTVERSAARQLDQ